MSSPLPILDDMPDLVKELVFENVGIKDRLNCRFLNYSIKTIIDKLPLTIHHVHVTIATNHTHTNPMLNLCIFPDPVSHTTTISDAAVRLNLLFAMPKVHIQNFTIDFRHARLSTQRDFLSSFVAPISCTKLTIWVLGTGENSNFFEFLSLFNSLEELHIEDGSLWPRKVDNLANMVEMAMFQNLKTLKVSLFCFGIRLDDIKHLKECEISPKFFTMEEMVELKRMCLVDGVTGFKIECSDVDKKALIKEFGVMCGSGWEFRNWKLKCCIKMEVSKCLMGGDRCLLTLEKMQ